MTDKPTTRQALDFEITTLVARARTAAMNAKHALDTYLVRLELSGQDVNSQDGCYAPALAAEALHRAIELSDELCGYANAVDTFRKAEKNK